MVTQVHSLSAKHALLFSYVFSYYFILVLIMALFFLWRVRSARFLSELSFYSNCAFLHTTLVLACITLAGLPPLFFFFPKFSLVAVVILQNTWYLSVCVLSLVFVGWFLYLNAVKTMSTQSWSFSAQTSFGARHVSTGLGLVVVIGFWALILGFFFIEDFFLHTQWLFK